jgi:hypothetical protein
MPPLRIATARRLTSDPRLAVLRAWLSLGVVAVILLPPSEWQHATLGWLPYWLLIAPLISLALLQRRRLAAALTAFLVRGRRRRNAYARSTTAGPYAPRAARDATVGGRADAKLNRGSGEDGRGAETSV